MSGFPAPAPRMGVDQGPAPRSAALTLCQAILALEALAVLFATAYLAGLSVADGPGITTAGPVWGIGLAVAIALVAAAGVQSRRWGRVAGWGLQAPMLLACVVSLPIAIVGVGFVGLWVGALRIGGRIDRERAAHRAGSPGAADGAP